MKSRNLRRRRRRRIAGAVGSAGLMVLASAGIAGANGDHQSTRWLGFAPITTNALACTANGYVSFARDTHNRPVYPTMIMQAGDVAKPINAPATSNKVGRVNDMIALSPDGRYLYTVSENPKPSDDPGPAGSDGVTRLTLTGENSGKREILAADVDAAGALVWQRVDGIKWYPHGGPNGAGVLLASEEFATGGIWQVTPETGAFARLSWMGDFAHEGIGLDQAGNLYLGDENRAGAIYKAVPNDVNDLTKGGSLSYMVSTTIDPSGWKRVVDPTKATPEASDGGAILFDRPEDFDEAFGRIYFTVTEPKGDADKRTGTYGDKLATPDKTKNQVVNRGGIYSFATWSVPEPAVQSGALPYQKLAPMIEVNDPTYTSQADAQAQQGLQFPDNLAFDGFGHLWVHEDIPDSDGSFPSAGIDVSKQTRNQQDELYVYVLSEDGSKIVPNPNKTGPGVSGGYKAADMRNSPDAKACENEFTGGIFANDGATLFINQQHADNPTLRVKLPG
jgi:hypothetical protein